MERNYYKVLGVARRASPESIEEAYKALSEIYNPNSDFYSEIVGEEKAGAEPVNNELFQIITAAYNTLINPVARETYDKTLPPEISGWKNENEKDTDLRATSSMAYGIFGSGFRVPQSSFESGHKTRRPTESVAEIVKEQNVGLFTKLFRFLGL